MKAFPLVLMKFYCREFSKKLIQLWSKHVTLYWNWSSKKIFSKLIECGTFILNTGKYYNFSYLLLLYLGYFLELFLTVIIWFRFIPGLL